MTMHIFLVLPFLLQTSSGRPQQQSQLVTQVLPPSQAVSLGPEALGPMQGPAASLGQIFLNLLNYKLQWLNQLAGHFTGLNPGQSASLKPGLLGALGALGSPAAFAAPGAPGMPGHPHFGHQHHGFPFMTTLVTTLSGNAPTVPGITIAGSPVNHLGTPGLYPGSLTTTIPPQDFHWIPPYAPDTQQPAQASLTPSAPAAQPAPAVAPPAAATPPAAPQAAVPPVQTPSVIPVIPTIDDIPVQTIIRPTIPAASAAPSVPTAPAAPAAPAAAATPVAPAAVAAPAASAAPAAPAAAAAPAATPTAK